MNDPVSPELKEEIARIIDPKAFSDEYPSVFSSRQYPAADFWIEERKIALAKAEQIITALNRRAETPSDLDLDALEKVAREATPGNWRQGRLGDPIGGAHCVDLGEPPKAPWVAFSKGNDGSGAMVAYPASAIVHSDDESSARNAAHIATFDPPTVLKLIAAVRNRRADTASGGRGEGASCTDIARTEPHSSVLTSTPCQSELVAVLKRVDRWINTCVPIGTEAATTMMGVVRAAIAKAEVGSPHPCRRCSACEGEEHHWMYCGDADEAGEPVMSCKHCEATRPVGDDDE